MSKNGLKKKRMREKQKAANECKYLKSIVVAVISSSSPLFLIGAISLSIDILLSNCLL